MNIFFRLIVEHIIIFPPLLVPMPKLRESQYVNVKWCSSTMDLDSPPQGETGSVVVLGSITPKTLSSAINPSIAPKCFSLLKRRPIGA